MKKKRTKFVYILLAICFIGLLSTACELNIFACILIGAGFVWLMKNGADLIKKYIVKDNTEEKQETPQK